MDGLLGVTDLVLTGQKDSTIQLKVKDKKNNYLMTLIVTIGSKHLHSLNFILK